jgi:hypothetical protein
VHHDHCGEKINNVKFNEPLCNCNFLGGEFSIELVPFQTCLDDSDSGDGSGSEQCDYQSGKQVQILPAYSMKYASTYLVTYVLVL